MRSRGQEQSRRQEARLSDLVGGARVPGSGSVWSRKGDVRSPELLLEAKWTGKEQFTLHHSVLRKIVTEALLDGRTPALCLSFGGTDNYVLLAEDDFIELWRGARGPLA